jgi:hypothetical protein
MPLDRSEKRQRGRWPHDTLDDARRATESKCGPAVRWGAWSPDLLSAASATERRSRPMDWATIYRTRDCTGRTPRRSPRNLNRSRRRADLGVSFFTWASPVNLTSLSMPGGDREVLGQARDPSSQGSRRTGVGSDRSDLGQTFQLLPRGSSIRERVLWEMVCSGRASKRTGGSVMVDRAGAA